MSGFRVCEKRCDECLFGPAPIVGKQRRRQVLADIARKDCHFICHKFTQIGEEACCRGDYDRNPARTNLMRIAGRLGAISFVPLPGEQTQLGAAPSSKAKP